MVKARVRGEPSYILIHLEHESGSRTHFPRRMFGYFARYHENEQWIYSYSQPKEPCQSRALMARMQVHPADRPRVKLERLAAAVASGSSLEQLERVI